MRRHPALRGEGIASRGGAIGVEPQHLAQIGAQILRRIALHSFTAADEQVTAIGAEHQLVAEMARAGHGGFLVPDFGQPGDLAGIITFVGGSAAQISATVVAKTNSKMLLLDRSRLESFLSTNPAIVYYVMRGIVRHVHGIVRRMNMQSVEMSNYIYQQGGRY